MEISLKFKTITIDGPAGSGKARIAKYLARKLKHYHLDSGILYRRLAFLLLFNNINLKKTKDIENFINNIKSISPRNNNKLRTEIISKSASKIAKYKFVRNFINKCQKAIIRKKIISRGCIIDGRDIGSVVFKKAQIKLYIEVNQKIRAERRYKQLIDIGEKSIYAKILKDIKLRDKRDKTRKNSPLKIPSGAIIIDNSLSFKHTVLQLKKIFKKI